jgi:DNA-binding response OmpR family regulator
MRVRDNDRIVVIDDEASVRDVVSGYLRNEGYVPNTAASGTEGLALAEKVHPALVVLDLVLPDISGEEICREMRARSDVPVLMLTANAGEDDRVAGLSLGADDYLVKPFSPRELVERVKAVLRGTVTIGVPLVAPLNLDGGRLQIDTVQHRVVEEGQPVDLTPSEYKLLVTLAHCPGPGKNSAD